jgi:hypothetical protein
MRLRYGTVDLDVWKLKEYRREVVEKDGQYLHTKVTLSVLAWYNPGLNRVANVAIGREISPVAVGPLVAPPVVAPALFTDRSLEQYLNTPRRPLDFYTGAVPVPGIAATPVPAAPTAIIFRSPIFAPNGIRYAVDALNGPMPVHCNVMELVGEKTMLVDFTVVSHICDTDRHVPAGLFRVTRQDSTPSPLTSLTFWMEEDLDDCFYSTLTVSGSATFRQDLMAARGLVPDDFRDYIGRQFPVPPFMKREKVEIKAMPGNTEITFRIIDKTIGMALTDEYRIAKAAVLFTETDGRDDPAGNIIAALKDLVKGGGIFNAKNILNAAFRVGKALLPKIGWKLDIQLWGKPDASRDKLHDAANLIQDTLMPPFLFHFVEYTSEATYDYTGTYVRLTTTMNANATNRILKLAGVNMPALVEPGNIGGILYARSQASSWPKPSRQNATREDRSQILLGSVPFAPGTAPGSVPAIIRPSFTPNP